MKLLGRKEHCLKLVCDGLKIVLIVVGTSGLLACTQENTSDSESKIIDDLFNLVLSGGASSPSKETSPQFVIGGNFMSRRLSGKLLVGDSSSSCSNESLLSAVKSFSIDEGESSKTIATEPPLREDASYRFFVQLILNSGLTTKSWCFGGIEYVLDRIGPKVNCCPVAIEGTYAVGESIDVAIKFNENTEVDTKGGVPQIALDIAGATRHASYHSGSGSSTLTFRYTVAANDSSSDSVKVKSPIDLAGGVIRDIAGNAGFLEFASSTTLANVAIDSIAPSVLSMTVADGLYGIGTHLDISLKFSENVVVDSSSGVPRIALGSVAEEVEGSANQEESGAEDESTQGETTIRMRNRYAAYESGSGSTTLVFRYIVVSGDNEISINSLIELNHGVVRDVAGNDLKDLSFDLPGDLSGLSFDTTPAKITAVTVTDGSYLTSSNVNISVRFNENMIVDVTEGRPRIALSIGDNTRYALYSSITDNTTLVFSYLVLPGDSDDDGIGMTSPVELNGGKIQDAGKTSSLLDFTLPSNLSNILVNGSNIGISNVAVSSGDYIVGSNLDISVKFSEDVTVTTTSGTPKISITVGSVVKNALYTSISESSLLVFRYVVVAGDNDSDGIGMTSPVDLSGGSIVGQQGNVALAFVLPDNVKDVIVDTTAPTISGVTVEGKQYSKGEHLDISVEWSEVVMVETGAGTPRISLTIGDASKYAVYHSGSESSTLVFRYTVVAGDFDDNGIAMVPPIDLNGGVVRDRVGNAAGLTFTIPSNLNSIEIGKNYIFLKKISAGASHSCVKMSDGGAKCWGDSTVGQLGRAFIYGASYPITVMGGESGSDNLEDVIQVATGASHSCAVISSGKVLCWGSPWRGELGNGDTETRRLTPVRVIAQEGSNTPLEGIAAISLGGSFSCALKINQGVVCWGRGDDGQLGHGAFNQGTGIVYPVTVVESGSGTNPFEGVVKVSAGSWHACALKSNKTVWCWGAGGSRQLGNGSLSRSNRPVGVLRKRGSSDLLANIIDLSVGSSHACVVRTDSTVWCWGNGNAGQLGHNKFFLNESYPVQVMDGAGIDNYLDDVIQVSSGGYHSCALKSDGTIWCWGKGGEGQLGNNALVDNPYAVQVVDGSGSSNALSDVIEIDMGNFHGCALKSNRTIRCWGGGGKGQLGNNSQNNRSYPVAVSSGKESANALNIGSE